MQRSQEARLLGAIEGYLFDLQLSRTVNSYQGIEIRSNMLIVIYQHQVPSIMQSVQVYLGKSVSLPYPRT